jgi:hypothetical protein
MAACWRPSSGSILVEVFDTSDDDRFAVIRPASALKARWGAPVARFASRNKLLQLDDVESAGDSPALPTAGNDHNPDHSDQQR